VRRIFYGLLGFNLLLLMTSLAVIGFALAAYQPWAAAQEVGGATAGSTQTWAGFISAALATMVSSIAAAWAVSRVGVAALGAITERPELFGRSIVYIGLAEGIAIYGIIISIMILGKL
jgi:V/A-type H+-transporting ATPase subunit K